MKRNDAESFFQILLSGVPRGSILGPVFFNLFIHDLFFIIKEAELANFAEDNKIYADSKDLTEFLLKECETAINWFKTNNIIVNPDKFQSMIISSKKDLSNSVLNINGVESIIGPYVKLLDIEIDNKLKFEKQISNICKKARKQLNAIFRLPTFMGHKEKESMINVVVHSDFNYGYLIWHFCSKNSHNKVEKNYERSLNNLLNGYLSSYTELL